MKHRRANVNSNAGPSITYGAKCANQILGFLYRHKWLGLSLLAAAMLLAIWGILYLEVEVDTRKFLPQNTAERKASQKIKELYNIDTEMIIAYRATDPTTDILDPKVLGTIAELTQKLQGLGQAPSATPNATQDVILDTSSSQPGDTDVNSDLGSDLGSDLLGDSGLGSDLDSGLGSDLLGTALADDSAASPRRNLAPSPANSLIRDIQTLNTISIMVPNSEGELEEKDSTSLQGQAFQQALQNWSLYDNILYSQDFRYGAIIVQPQLDLSSKQYQMLYQKVLATLQTFEGEGLQFFPSGEAVIMSAVGNYMLRDLSRLIPLVALMACAILYFYFRRVSALIIILLPVAFALLATVGLMGWLGVKFTFVHACIPVIIIALGSANSIHILNRFIHKKPGKNTDAKSDMLARILASQRELLLPVTLTSITTSIGFLAFATSVMLPIRSFGLFNAIGIGFVWFFSLFVASLLLSLYRPRNSKQNIEPQKNPKLNSSWPSRWQGRLNVAELAWNFTRLLTRYPYISRVLVLCSSALLLLIPHVQVNNDTIGYFQPSSAVVLDSQVINENLGGIYTINIDIQAEDFQNTVTEPQVLQYMAALASYVRRQNPQLVGKTIGLQDFVLQLNELLNPAQSAQFPANRQTVAQYLSLYSGNLDDFVSPDVYEAHNARLSIYLNDGNRESIEKVLQDIEEYRSQNQIAGYSQLQSGTTLMVNSMNQLVVREQIRSIIFALTGVLLIVLACFRSLRLALLACLPPAVTLLLNLVFMALLRINLDIPTALINSLVIGVGIDYGIHLISAYRKHPYSSKQLNQKQLGTSLAKGNPQGIQLALKQVSASILLNAVAVGLGYATLIFSQFRSLAYFGGLSSLANIIAAVLTLLALPILLLHKKERKFL